MTSIAAPSFNVAMTAPSRVASARTGVSSTRARPVSAPATAAKDINNIDATRMFLTCAPEFRHLRPARYRDLFIVWKWLIHEPWPATADASAGGCTPFQAVSNRPAPPVPGGQCRATLTE